MWRNVLGNVNIADCILLEFSRTERYWVERYLLVVEILLNFVLNYICTQKIDSPIINEISEINRSCVGSLSKADEIALKIENFGSLLI